MHHQDVSVDESEAREGLAGPNSSGYVNVSAVPPFDLPDLLNDLTVTSSYDNLCPASGSSGLFDRKIGCSLLTAFATAISQRWVLLFFSALLQ